MQQANAIKQQLESRFDDVNIQLVPLSTKGDEILDRSLAKLAAKVYL